MKESGDESPHSKMLTLRERLIERILRLPPGQLAKVDETLVALEQSDSSSPSTLECDDSSSPSLAAQPLSDSKQTDARPEQQPNQSGDQSPHSKDWPHAPMHRLSEHGTYIVTAGTLHKEHLFRGRERLTLVESKLLALARECGWQLEAWAVFSNHYHFVAHALAGCEKLDGLLKRLHGDTATTLNRLDERPGRELWYNFWDTQLTFEKSYLARLNYVHQNAVKHGLVRVANQYPWCSAAWFERTASRAQVRTIYSFKTGKVKVVDDFDPVGWE